MSLPVIERLLAHPRVKAAKTILMYHSLPDEVYTHEALDQLLSEGKTVYLPVVIADGLMDIQAYHGRDDLQQGAFHIMEPSTSHPLPITYHLLPKNRLSPQGEPEGAFPPIDVAVIPGMAFDPKGNRLGRGKGYYDRFLSSLPVYTIGLCFPFQKVAHIPTTPLDIPVDEVI